LRFSILQAGRNGGLLSALQLFGFPFAAYSRLQRRVNVLGRV